MLHKRLSIEVFTEIIILVLAIVLTIVYFTTDMPTREYSLDALLVALWALVLALLVSIFQTQNAIRQERLRRFFISEEWVYNHEIGCAPLEKVAPDCDALQFVMFVGDALAKMSYGFTAAKKPEDFKPQFMISSTKFKFHKIGERHHLIDKGVVIDKWKGTLQRIGVAEDGDYVYMVVGSYANAKELAILLDSNDVLGVSGSGEGIIL